MARYILRNNPVPESQRYPDRCLAVMMGALALNDAYAMTQADVQVIGLDNGFVESGDTTANRCLPRMLDRTAYRHNFPGRLTGFFH